MKKLWIWALVVVVVAAVVSSWLYGHHVIRTSQGTVILSKRFLTFHETCADTRTWTSKDFDKHPAVKDVLIRNGYDDMLRELRHAELKQSVADFIDATDRKFEEFKAEVINAASEWMGKEEEPSDVGEPAPAAAAK